MTARRRQQRAAATLAAARTFLNARDAGGGLIGPVTRRAARLSAALRAADQTRAAGLFQELGNATPRPAGADWAWRPEPWFGERTLPDQPENGALIAPGVKLFHDDGGAGRMVLAASGQPPRAIRLTPHDFGGSYVSFAIDLPQDALAVLSLRHILGLGAVVLYEGTAPWVYVRLTLMYGPNRMAATVRPNLPDGGGAGLGEFDMFTMGLRDRRAESGWFDLVLAHPGNATITIRDIVLYRRFRSAV